MLDAGAPKDLPNTLGWTSLHEACFYNRIDVVRILLLSGVNATIRTKSGALPYHVAGLQVLRAMLTEMGGSGAVPNEGDVIDMVSVLRELTMPENGEMVEGNDGKNKNIYSISYCNII